MLNNWNVKKSKYKVQRDSSRRTNEGRGAVPQLSGHLIAAFCALLLCLCLFFAPLPTLRHCGLNADPFPDFRARKMTFTDLKGHGCPSF